MWTARASAAGPDSNSAATPNGEVQQAVDGNGHATTYTFDNFGRRIGIADADGNTTRMTLDRAGQTLTLTDPDSNVTTFTYDRLERETKQVDQLGHVMTFTYNALGEMTSETTPMGGTRIVEYDFQGREFVDTFSGDNHNIGMLSPSSNTYSYDKDGHLLTATNVYGTYTFTYDAANRLSSIVEPGSVTLTPSYDPAGNRTQLVDSLGGTTTNGYDHDNNLENRTFTDGTITLRVAQGYDQLNRVSNQGFFNGSTLIVASLFTYDSGGNITGLSYPSNLTGGNIASATYTYDPANQLKTQTLNGASTSDTADAARADLLV